MISVIIPFYNEIDLIHGCVASVFQSNWGGDIEILICNDGSFDNGAILTNLPPFPAHVHVFVINNMFGKGVAGARNTGIKLSKGDLIFFLDADDKWIRKDKISRQYDLFKKGVTFSCTGYHIDHESNMVNPPERISSPSEILTKRGIGTSTVAVSRALVSNARFDDIKYSQDIDFWYRLASSSVFSYSSLRDSMVFYRSGGGTKNKLVQLKYFLKVLRKNNVSCFVFCKALASYSINGIIKHFFKRFI